MARRVVGLVAGAAGAAALLGAAVLAGPALATPAQAGADVALALAADGSGTDGTDGAGGTGEAREDRLTRRLERACGRIPTVLHRIDRAEERLGGDASTRGSLLWLEAKADEARERGLDDLAAALDARADYRRQVQPLLPERRAMLEAAQDGICSDVDAAVDVLK